MEGTEDDRKGALPYGETRKSGGRRSGSRKVGADHEKPSGR